MVHGHHIVASLESFTCKISVYYFYQASLNLVILETSIPAVPVQKQNNFLTLVQEKYSACSVTATFD